MKKTLLTAALVTGLAFCTKAQTVYFSGFENWAAPTAGTFTNNTTVPTDWMGSKTTFSITVSQVTTGAEQGNFCANITNTTTTAVRLTTQPVPIVQGSAYLVSYYAKGKGSIRTGLYTGKSTSAGFGYAAYSSYISVSGNTWHKYSQSVIADTNNTTTAQFILSVKSTGTYTTTGGTGNIVGLDIDSVSIVPYTIPTVSLYNIQYTTASNGYSPYYGKYVNTTGIVTATYSAGFYVQTPGVTSWGGALGYCYTKPSWMNQGDNINFLTYVDEYYAGGATTTELDVDTNNIVHVSSGNTLPTPVSLLTGLIADEQYEGILVTTQNVATCMSYTATYQQGSIDDGSGAIGVDRQLYPYTYVVGAQYKVTGPVYNGFGFNIEPRYAADIQMITGIEKYENNLHANVYPNPVANNLTIQLPFVADKATVSVSDIMGREVITSSASGTNVNVNTTNLEAGTYFVKITADGKTQVAKIIKQ